MLIISNIIFYWFSAHYSYKRADKMVEKPHCCFNNQPFFKVHSQQICEFLTLPNFLLSSPLLASSPVSIGCVRSSLFFYDLYATDRRRLSFHIAGADSELSLAPACDRSYRVRPGDICDSIAIQQRAPTLVSLYITTAHFTYPLIYSYQIMCENEQIDGKCSNLSIGEVRCVLKILLRTF